MSQNEAKAAEDPPALRGRDHLAAFAMGAAPHAFALLAFLCGGVLLATSAFPALAPRMAVLADAAPLLVIELSHFVASVIGLLLLIVAAGLWRKREGAYVAALGLLIIGALAALLRGLDYEEASLLGAVALGLYACRGAFVRRSRLLREPLTLPWFAGIVATLAGRRRSVTSRIAKSPTRTNSGGRFCATGMRHAFCGRRSRLRSLRR